ncbi:hypothetical protein Q7C36_011785 [Tachysurus vachellii]|uniref:Uncharacterized protein n=1 Tax=Tachysurus vachellii TaxID=175792 RepID=A0AA88SLN1_TACVA|nr:hypothetical protein Q7C36_011785 [Tachysurus vachellii]
MVIDFYCCLRHSSLCSSLLVSSGLVHPPPCPAAAIIRRSSGLSPVSFTLAGVTKASSGPAVGLTALGNTALILRQVSEAEWTWGRSQQTLMWASTGHSPTYGHLPRYTRATGNRAPAESARRITLLLQITAEMLYTNEKDVVDTELLNQLSPGQHRFPQEARVEHCGLSGAHLAWLCCTHPLLSLLLQEGLSINLNIPSQGKEDSFSHCLVT